MYDVLIVFPSFFSSMLYLTTSIPRQSIKMRTMMIMNPPYSRRTKTNLTTISLRDLLKSRKNISLPITETVVIPLVDTHSFLPRNFSHSLTIVSLLLARILVLPSNRHNTPPLLISPYQTLGLQYNIYMRSVDLPRSITIIFTMLFSFSTYNSH